MANKIILKKSSVAAKAPVAGDLDFGELAINYTDSKLYFKKADGSIDAFISGAVAAPVTSVGGNIGDITDAQLLASIKNVDGAGSGLDADFLDGNHASAFYLATNPNGYTSNTGTVTSVGATSPLVSSGGTTPSLSIPAANSTTNGYMSSAYASKLDGIAAGAQVNVATNLSYTTAATNGTVNSSTGTNATVPAATTTLAGLMTGADKTKLDGIAAGATANTGTVTSVGGTGGYGGLTLSGTVTTSGNLTLGGTPTGSWPISVTGSSASTTGNAATATKWATGRTITLTGDVTGVSGAFDGSGNLSFATTIAANSVALGTDTTGNYVAGLTAGQGIAITGTAGEGWSPTVSLTALDLTLFPTSNYKKSVRAATTANITLSAPQTIDGVALVAGNRVLVKNQTTASQNGIYIVNAAAWTRSTAADGSTEIDSAVVGVDQGTVNGGLFFSNVFKSTDVLGTTAMPWYKVTTELDQSSTNVVNKIVSRDGSGNFSAGTITAALSGNSTTATTLQTARTINGTSFNGSANITTANWGTARTINGTSINGSTNYTTANWGTARTLTIGGTGKSVNGSANVAWSVAEVIPATTALSVASLTASGNIVANSDENLKKDWVELPTTFVNDLAGIKSGTYTRIDTGERQAGSSAQDWQKLLPEVVVRADKEGGVLSLAYGNAALVSAIELAKKVVSLEQRLAKLEKLLS